MSENETTVIVSLEALKSQLLSGEVSVFEMMGPVEPGDYWGAVQQRRVFLALSQDWTVLEIILREVRTKAARVIGEGDDIKKRFSLKDVERHYSRLTSERCEAFAHHASLLTGGTFDACVSQFKALIGHVEAQWRAASELCLSGNFPLAAFVSILVIEEIGKLTHLGEDLIWFDAGERRGRGSGVARDHHRKQLIGVLSGALVNARVDRVLGLDVVRRILGEAKNNVLERTRQSCLYIDIGRGGPVLPEEVVSEERARELTVLAGELMAEGLGNFPWEFDRMLDRVVRFEVALGMPEAKVSRSASPRGN